MGKDNSEFNFLDEVMPDVDRNRDPDPKMKEIHIKDDSYVLSSYLLVNALLHLLVKKNVISHNEVSPLVFELFQELKAQGGFDN